MRIKVGMMPGRLVEVEVQEGLTANEIFEKANVEISNHEIRLDGEKISLDTVINNGGLLVAMKMIKGNARTIKVGLMPGRLTELSIEDGLTASEIFNRAGVEISNHEIRLDGEKIALDTIINNGSLLVAMKMIKGNSDVYVSDCTTEEIEMLLEVALPKMINAKSVNKLNCNLVEININGVEGESVIVEESMFNSVYTLKSEQEILEVNMTNQIQERQDENMAIKVLEEELALLQAKHQRILEEAKETTFKMTFVQDILRKLGM